MHTSEEKYRLCESPNTIFDTLKDLQDWVEANKTTGEVVTVTKIVEVTKV